MRGVFLAFLVVVFFSSCSALQLTTFSNGTSHVNISLESAGFDSSALINIGWNSNITSVDLEVYGSVLNVITGSPIGNGENDNYIFSDNLRNVFVNNSRVFIVDDGRHRIMVYNSSSNNFLFRIGTTDTAGNSNDLLDNPHDVCSNGSYIFVADHDNHRIMVYNYSGNYSYKFGSYGAADDQFNNPKGIFVDSQYVYVADSANNRVKIHYLNGTYRYKFGSYGAGNYQFNDPTDVYVGPNGYLYVVDSGNQRVMVYDSDWLYVTVLGTTGQTGVGNKFNFPKSIAVSSNYVYVADTYNHRISVYRVSGHSYEQDIGVAGVPATSSDDITHLNSPYGVSFEGSDVWISDTGVKRVVRTVGYLPSNISLDSCADGNVDWSMFGELSGATSATLTASDINSCLVSCSRDESGNCSFSIRVGSDTPGFIVLQSLDLDYDVIPICTLNGSNPGFDYYLSVVKNGAHITGSPFHVNPSYELDLVQNSYNLTMAVDTVTQTLNNVFYFYGIQLLTSNHFNQIFLDNPSTTAFDVPDKTPLLLSCVSLGSIPYYYSNLVFSWSSVSPSLIEDEANLTLYKCQTWDFQGDYCAGSWSSVSASKDTASNLFTTTQTSATGCYAIVSEEQATLYVNASLNQSSYNGGCLGNVTGYVNSSAGVPVENATVLFDLYDSSSNLYDSGYVLSNSSGKYSFEFLNPQKTDTFRLVVSVVKAGFINNSLTKYFGVTGCDTLVSLCLDQTNCTNNGGYWCTDHCQSRDCDVVCSSSSCDACSAESNCTLHGCYWCFGVCQGGVCGICSSQTLGSCLNSDDCSGAGGVWAGSQCYAANETCNALYPGLCLTQSTCEGAGAEWCGSSCKSICASLVLEQTGANETDMGGEFDFRVKITNDYDVDMVDTIIKVTGLSAGMYSVKPSRVTLRPGQTQNFLIHIVIPEDKRLSDYDISYFVESYVNGRLTTSLLNGFVQTIDLPPKVFTTFVVLDDTVTAGKRVNFRVNVHNARDTPVSVKLVYKIKKANSTVAEKTEEIFVTNETTFAQTLLVPVTTLQGKYTFEVVTLYGDKSSSEEALFNIELARPWLFFIVALVIAVAGVVYALKFRGRVQGIGEIDEAYKGFDPKKFKKQ